MSLLCLFRLIPTRPIKAAQTVRPENGKYDDDELELTEFDHGATMLTGPTGTTTKPHSTAVWTT